MDRVITIGHLSPCGGSLNNNLCMAYIITIIISLQYNLKLLLSVNVLCMLTL